MPVAKWMREVSNAAVAAGMKASPKVISGNHTS
jgi:hypothetical protein